VARESGPDLEALFFDEVARVRRRQGRYAEALEHARRAVELREKHWGAHHPLTSRAKRRLADVYFKQRDFRAAETIGLTVLEDLSSYVGPHHPDIATVQSLLGAIAWRRGFYQSADERFAEVQRIWTRLFGPDDPRAVDAVRDRASVHVSAGQFSTAWSELEPILASPPDPREDSVARANMALTAGEALTGMGRYDRAAGFLDFALAEYTRTKGPEGVVVGYTLIALGRLALARGNPMKARELCGRAVEIWHNRLGEGHPNLSWAYSCLGLAELSSGRDTRAAGALERARLLYDGNVDDPKNLAEIELYLKSARRDQPGPALALQQKLSNAAGGRSRP